MAKITLFCLVKGAETSFSVKVLSDGTVDDVKDAILKKKSKAFNDLDADELTLWHVSIPTDKNLPALLASFKEEENLVRFLSNKPKLMKTTKLSKVFDGEPPEDTIHIFVQRPPSSASKRSLEDASEGPSSKRRRPQTLIDAIEEAGLAKKAMVEGLSDLSRLNNKDRVSLLRFIGQDVDMTNPFNLLLETARALHGSSFEKLDLISSPSNKPFSATSTKQLFIRETYQYLYDEIVLKFEDPRNRTKRVTVSGTAGIGKSAFLIYFIIRLLATSSDDNPPLVIFQGREESSTCYVYGGLTTIRYGAVLDFRPFLHLPETWYLVDSSPNPLLADARSVYSASPKTLISDEYQEIDKRVVWNYHMAPWRDEELEQCRKSVERFNVVSDRTFL
ncbi:hypothetical protein BGX34_004755 [Mortierella sp. NVP85]|nr:hypothetical protein BGX34_004755 [Mortierella sp. NVP85]